MVEHIGFFHFVQNYGDPLDELMNEFQIWNNRQRNERIGSSLIVLPEAFNLGRKFSTTADRTIKEKPKFGAEVILQSLHQIAANDALLFVVGLIDEQRRNCAYFVDGKTLPQLMCCKIGDDSSGEYDSCFECPPSRAKNPLEYAETCIGSLICMDAIDQGNPRGGVKEQYHALRERRVEVLSRLTWSKRPIVCVPAAFSIKTLWGNDMPGKIVVVANALPNSPSLIVDATGRTVRSFDANANKICLIEIGLTATAIPE